MKTVVELEKSQVGRLFTMFGFTPALLYLGSQSVLSSNQRKFSIVMGVLTFSTVGYAYMVNRDRLKSESNEVSESSFKGNIAHSNVKRDIKATLEGQKVRLYADLMIIAPFLIYLGAKGKVTNTDRVVLGSIAAVSFIYNYKNYVELSKKNMI